MGGKTLVKNTLVFGIILLFIISAVTPLVIGDRVGINSETQVTVLEGPPNVEWIRIFDSISGSEDGDAVAESVKQANDGGYIIAGQTGYLTRVDAFLIKTDAKGRKEWDKIYGKPGVGITDFARDITLTSDGGYAFTGHSNSYNIDEEMEVWLVKTDAEGDMQWYNTFGYGRGFSIKQATDGGYIIAGDSWPKGLLIKTDENGNEQWRKILWGSIDRGSVSSVDVTSDGGFVLTGTLYYAEPYVENDVFLIKTDINGTEQINTTFGGPKNSARGESVQRTTDGGYIMTGFIHYNNTSGTKMWLIKTDANGTVEWDTSFGEDSVTYCGHDCRQTIDGGYIIACERFVDLEEPWLIKTDSNGNERWRIKLVDLPFYDETINSVDVTDDGGFIVAGERYLMNCDALLIKVEAVKRVSITKPENALYLFNNKILPLFFRPLIIGPIDIEVVDLDDEFYIDRVEFYIDDEFQANDTTEPYGWTWDKMSFFRHTLKVTAINTNKTSVSEELIVWKFL